MRVAFMERILLELFIEGDWNLLNGCIVIVFALQRKRLCFTHFSDFINKQMNNIFTTSHSN